MPAAAIIAFKGGQIIATGFAMGIGVWLSRKVTDVIDEKFFIYDIRTLNKVKGYSDVRSEIVGYRNSEVGTRIEAEEALEERAV